jgi:hypothetical protein
LLLRGKGRYKSPDRTSQRHNTADACLCLFYASALDKTYADAMKNFIAITRQAATSPGGRTKAESVGISTFLYPFISRNFQKQHIGCIVCFVYTFRRIYVKSSRQSKIV